MIWTLIFALGLILGIFGIMFTKDEYEHENLFISSFILAIASGLVLLMMLVTIITEHTYPEHKVAQLQAERDALVYQMDHQLYLGDALGEFNKKIICMRQTRENPWTSWFQGDYIYEVEPIDLN